MERAMNFIRHMCSSSMSMCIGIFYKEPPKKVEPNVQEHNEYEILQDQSKAPGEHPHDEKFEFELWGKKEESKKESADAAAIKTSPETAKISEVPESKKRDLNLDEETIMKKKVSIQATY